MNTKTPTKWYSLKKNLLFLVLGGTSAIWLATAILSYYDIHHEIDELIDRGYLIGDKADDNGERKSHKTIHQHHNNDTHAKKASNLKHNHKDDKDNDENKLETNMSSEEIHSELIEHLVLRLLAPALLGLPIIALWIYIILYYNLRPLSLITSDITNRKNDDLQEIYAEKAPSEIQPLISALNHLFQIVAANLENERRFSDAAAHELRTPLAGLHAQLQVAIRAGDLAKKDRALNMAFLSSKKLNHLLQQLLTFSRLQPTEKNLAIISLNVAAVITATIEELQAAADSKALKIHWQANDLFLPLNQFALEVMLRNIIDNAIRYSHAGGNIYIELTNTATKWQIQISDEGPGISAENRQKALQRFTRFAGQDIDGCGLGLSIAARCAQILAGQLILSEKENGENGLVVKFAAATSKS